MPQSENNPPEIHRVFDPVDCEITITPDTREKLAYPFVNINFRYQTGQIGQVNIPQANLEILKDAIIVYMESNL